MLVFLHTTQHTTQHTSRQSDTNRLQPDFTLVESTQSTVLPETNGLLDYWTTGLTEYYWTLLDITGILLKHY